MFTGLVETLGTITAVRPYGRSVELCVRADARGYDVLIGGSVAVDGACLTVEKIGGGGEMYFTAVAETLRRTSLDRAASGRRVNLERAMRADGRLDGHIVLGHIDAVGRIINDEHVGVSLVRTIEVPSELTPFIAEKGSIAIDGISLTVAKTAGRALSISLIPATVNNTTMSLKKVGDTVNVECDVFARYIYNMLKTADASGGSLLDKMKAMGF